jgi:hypothetical protein
MEQELISVTGDVDVRQALQKFEELLSDAVRSI